MKLFNLHTHTTFSDGKSEAEDYVREAIRQGFDVLGFSEHAPVSMENNFAIRQKDLQTYVDRISELKEKYAGSIEIYTALEMDYIPGVTGSFSDLARQLNLDYVIGSVHLVKNGRTPNLWFIDGPEDEIYDRGLEEVFDGDIRKAVKAYFDQLNEMVITQKPDIIGHMDKVKMHNKGRYFETSDKWYRDLIRESLEQIKANDCIVEVNTRGVYKKRSDTLFPDEEVLTEIHKMNIPVTITSDAHQPGDLSEYFPETIQILKSCGFSEVYCFKDKRWKERSL